MVGRTEVEAVQSVVTGVVHHIDRRNWAKLRDLFDDLVRTDYRSLFGGEIQDLPADELLGNWRRVLTPLVTQHIIGAIDVEFVDSVAIAHCHVRGYHFLKGAPSGDEWMVAGHYVFALVTIAGMWKIREMTLETYYQTGNQDLLREAAAISAIGR
jgi:hypothetical protein